MAALILPTGLPAIETLRHEGITVVEGESPVPFAEGVEPLTIALVNIMPDKPTTEVQFGRLLAGADRPVRVVLVLPDGYVPQTAAPGHVERFYRRWSEIDRYELDGIVITGAPVEHLAFSEVRYWTGMSAIFSWVSEARLPAMHVCWAAMAALWHDHGVPKQDLGEKRFGVYPHVPLTFRSPILRGAPLPLDMPVSRWAEVRLSDLPIDGSVRPLALAPVSGLGMAEDLERRAIYLLNHPEYDADTLDREYERDRARGVRVTRPDPARTAARSWEPIGRALFRNWLTELGRLDLRDRPLGMLELLLRIQTQGGASLGGASLGGASLGGTSMACSETRH